MKNKIYPREGDRQTVYLKEVVSDPNIEVGEWTIYNLSLIHISEPTRPY